MNDQCDICNEPLGDGACFPWIGAPFSVRKVHELCSFCGHVMKPRSVQLSEGSSVNLIGTFDGDIFTLDEMQADGFKDKIRLTKSIKALGERLGMSKKEINVRLGKA